MARRIRINWPGALYHVTDRGNERQVLFRDDLDRRRFLEYLEKAAKKYSLLVHAFCLMPNHYHLEIETPRGNISAALQWLKTTYTVNFNRRHHRVGHLFQGRFKGILVEKEEHLLELTRYIHLNPVRAGLVSLPDEYAWSSYTDYIPVRKKWKWLVTGETLHRFGTRAREQRKNYRRFVEEGLRDETENPLDRTIGSIVLGSKGFVKWIDAILSENGTGKCEHSRCMRLETYSVGEIIETVSRVLNVPVDTIWCRGRSENRAREVAVYLAHKYCGETNAALGRHFNGMTGSGISYICRKVATELERSRKFRRLLERVELNLSLEA